MVPNEYRGYKSFLDSRAHLLLAYTFDGDSSAKRVYTAVVDCSTAQLRLCQPVVECLVDHLKEQGWNCFTNPRLCDSTSMGLIVFAGWEGSSVMALSEAMGACGSDIRCVCVFDADTKEFVDAVNKRSYGVIAFGDGTYYKDPDDRMNTSAPLVLAKRYTVHELSEAQEQARLVEGDLEIWEFCNDNPVRKVDAVPGEKITGKYGNKTSLPKLKPMDLFG